MGGPTLDEFKARLPLAEVVGRYVRLTRRGREHTGLCPFHKEKTPSFNVVEEKGFYHCFGCGAHGNAIDFVMALEGLSFPDALHRLADMTGLPPPTREGAERPQADKGLAQANAAAARFFRECLWGPEGAEARAYLKRRGCGRAAVERFGLGYAPAASGLGEALGRQGYGEGLLVEAGLLARREGDGRAYERFRHRLMFPIGDARGRIVGFGGRALGEAKAKYLNTPETPLFHKGRLLYGLPLAAKAARARRRLVLVEGYMDVVALSEAGIEEAVAPLGTAVTEDQLRLLWRHADAPLVCLDGDRAGMAAALRTARRALPVMQAGQGLHFVVMPEGEDPDSLIRSRGVEAMHACLGAAVPLSQMVWQAEWAAVPVTTPEAFAGLRKRVLDYAGLAGDPGLRGALKDRFYALLDAHRPSGRRDRFARPPPAVERAKLGASLHRVGGDVLAAVLLAPGVLSGIDEALAEVEFDDPGLEALKQEILVWFAGAPALDGVELRDHLTRYGFESLVESVLGVVALDTEAHGVAALQRKLDELRYRHALRRERSMMEPTSTGEALIEELQAKREVLNRLLNGPKEEGD